MKIAVACQGQTVCPHFGHCEHFMFFDTRDGRVTASRSLPNPGHKPGFLPNYLADQGAQVVICGGVGGGALDIFYERGVTVVSGAAGDAQAAAEAYLAGKMTGGASPCKEHDHQDECGQEH